jgi:hypothetical protein
MLKQLREQTAKVFINILGSSDVPARLGSKAPALAWPRTALAFKILEPGRGPKPGQSRGLAWPGDGFWKENKNNLHVHHTKLTRMVLLAPVWTPLPSLQPRKRVTHVN